MVGLGMGTRLPWPDAKGYAWQGQKQPSALCAVCLGSVGVFVGACAHVACFVVLLVVFIVVWANDNRGRWLAAAFCSWQFPGSQTGNPPNDCSCELAHFSGKRIKKGV